MHPFIQHCKTKISFYWKVLATTFRPNGCSWSTVLGLFYLYNLLLIRVVFFLTSEFLCTQQLLCSNAVSCSQSKWDFRSSSVIFPISDLSSNTAWRIKEKEIYLKTTATWWIIATGLSLFFFANNFQESFIINVCGLSLVLIYLKSLGKASKKKKTFKAS